MDAEYLAAVERGDMETAQRMVLEAAKLAMPNTKVVDENGNPKVVYHGSNAQFTKFDTARIGSTTGTADGRGFYFTTDRDYAEGYVTPDGQLFDVYLNIQKPLSYEKKTITKAQLRKILKEADKVEFEREGEHYMLSNYANYYDVGIDGAVNEGANLEYDYADNDVEMVGSLIGGSGSFELIMDAVRKVTGKSGMIAPKNNGTTHYVVTDPAAIKSAEPVTYDDNGNVIPLSERFNPENEDIRFSASGPITYDNFYKETAGVWEIINPSEVPLREADYTSTRFMRPDLVSSRYWYGSDEKGDYVIRESDHWSASLHGENGINDFMANPSSRKYTPISSARWAIDMRNATEEGTYNKVKPEFFKDGKAYGKIYLSDLRRMENIRFSIANENQAIFVSNAARAVEAIKMEKATPEQWLKMIEKNGGLKAGEDKWMGLSDWLKSSDKKTLTKQEVLDFINENMIVIEEQHYAENAEADAENTHAMIERILQEKFGNYIAEYYEQNNGEDDNLYGGDSYEYAMDKLREEMNDEFPYTIERSNSVVYLTFPYEETDDLQEWADKLGVKFAPQNPINNTRLAYTTDGLNNRHEIALIIPTIEPWNESDEVHFGDAREGRAVAWIRFGETWEQRPSPQISRKVLVIDEIQSKRHQEGREKGYRTSREDVAKATEAFQSFNRTMKEKYGENVFPSKWSEEDQAEFDRLRDEHARVSKSYDKGIPDAPFDKNWHELAMKRMLRYAAEEGYDVIAWTKGEQQAERYDIGTKINHIHVIPSEVERYVSISPIGGRIIATPTEPDSDIIVSGEYKGKSLSDVYGKTLADRIMSIEIGSDERIVGDGLRIGGEGMKGFYDRMLPAFMNKYGKKWGVKVEDIELPSVKEAGRVMHSVPVTEEMKASVMEGQVMFSVRNTPISPEVRAEMDVIAATAMVNGNYMLAPNGQPTKLTADQWAMVRTKAFKAWFGDWELPYKMIDIVRGTMNHGFANFDDARQWAKDNIVRVYGNEETGGKGNIEISNNAVKKYLSGSAVKKSDSKDLHLAVMKVLPSVIRNGVIAETHADYMKDENGERTAESSINPDVTIHRVYGAVRIGDEIYRVKVTLKEHKDANRANTPHSYEATKIELLAGTLVGAKGSNPNTNNSISAANLLKGVEKSYESGKYLLDDYSKVVDENGEPMVVYHGSNWRPVLDEQGKAIFKMRSGMMGRGAYFTDNIYTALYFAADKYEMENGVESVSEGFLDENGYVTEVFLNIRNEENIRTVLEDTYYLATDPSQIKSATDNTGEFSESEDIRFSAFRPVGGNRGYVGYSMSKRAAAAREEGRYPKTDFRKEYGVTEKALDALVKAGIINNSEWHHTSVYGNKTTVVNCFRNFYL